MNFLLWIWPGGIIVTVDIFDLKALQRLQNLTMLTFPSLDVVAQSGTEQLSQRYVFRDEIQSFVTR
jgi:hypothetical protein